jgi:hypothetical protein
LTLRLLQVLHAKEIRLREGPPASSVDVADADVSIDESIFGSQALVSGFEIFFRDFFG